MFFLTCPHRAVSCVGALVTASRQTELERLPDQASVADTLRVELVERLRDEAGRERDEARLFAPEPAPLFSGARVDQLFGPERAAYPPGLLPFKRWALEIFICL